MGSKIPGRIKKALEEKIKKSEKIIFFLDYDGTITPIRKKPQFARIGKRARGVLKELSEKKWAEIFILTGRSIRDVRKLAGLRTINCIGNHGIEIEGKNISYKYAPALKMVPVINKIHAILKRKIRQKGTVLENKTYTLSLHYRASDKKDIPSIKKSFMHVTAPFIERGYIKVTKGKKVLEVRPDINWNKGLGLLWVLSKKTGKKYLPICIGDDITDEDAFSALGKKGITIFVSNSKRKTKARYRLKDPGEVLSFLKWIMLNRRKAEK